MALMTAGQRALARAWLADYWSRRKSFNASPAACQLDNPGLDAFLDAVDGWRNDNASAYNLAIPAAIRNKLTPEEKALGLTIVIAASNDFPLP